MTGNHTGHTSVRTKGGGAPLLPEDVRVAEVLKQAGYATGGFGKWGLGDHGTTGAPYQPVFDEFFGHLHQVHAHYISSGVCPGNAECGSHELCSRT